jgi:hypothetical protein
MLVGPERPRYSSYRDALDASDDSADLLFTRSTIID